MTTSEFIALLKARTLAPKKTANGWEARCPAHDDGRASLSVSAGQDGRIMLHCHAGCKPEAVTTALGVKMADLFPSEKRNGKTPGKIEATYDYTDKNGKLRFQVCRYQPKHFLQRRPDGKGGWTWNMQGVERVPYKLTELVKAVAAGRPVFICEGEKDVDSVVKAGFAATCNPGGAGQWLDSFARFFKGAEVAIIADRDKPGRDHAQAVAKSLSGTAANIRVLELPDTNGKPVKDAADFFNAGGTAAGLDELAQAAPPPPEVVETNGCADIRGQIIKTLTSE